MSKAIDRYIGLEWLKKKVDAAHKEAKEQAIDDLATLTGELGVTEMTSTLFGPEAGNLKYSKVREKKVTEFNVIDECDLFEWIGDNPGATKLYARENKVAFAEWWFEQTGEVPDGVSRVEYVEPAKVGPAKLYKFDPDVVEAKFGNNVLLGANELLLGDGDE